MAGPESKLQFFLCQQPLPAKPSRDLHSASHWRRQTNAKLQRMAARTDVRGHPIPQTVAAHFHSYHCGFPVRSRFGLDSRRFLVGLKEERHARRLEIGWHINR